MKVAIYARVSKEEEGLQEPENQLIPLRQYANSLNYEVFAEYVDRCSGGDSNRPEFQRMMGMVRQHRFGLVLIWALDRFSREPLINTLKYIEDLKGNGVGLKSYTEGWLDTSQQGVGELLLAIFGWVAAEERRKISQRTKAALQRKKNLGQKLGRPRKTPPPIPLVNG